MANYTPGPWKVAIGKDNMLETKFVYGSVMSCADEAWHIARIWDDIPESAANAALIAAAPELASALRPFAALLQHHHRNMDDSHPLFRIGDATITAGDLRNAVNACCKAGVEP